LTDIKFALDINPQEFCLTLFLQRTCIKLILAFQINTSEL
jgi:hypothetical protein